MSTNFDYYELKLKLDKEQLATCCEASIYDQHVLKTAQKKIKLANKLSKKVAKDLQKFKGVEVPPSKEIEELKGILRSYMALLGRTETLPADHDELLDLAKEFETEFEELISDGSQKKATVFMKDEDGHAIISSHMLLGMLKEAARITTNQGNKTFIKTKVGVSECFTLDAKVVEDFLKPSKDIIRNEAGDRVLLERPIRFNRMGETVTAIAISEQLPKGTEYLCHLRVRKGSPITQEYLEYLLDMGKNCGVGAWRSSGNMGKFKFQLELLPDYKEPKDGLWR